MREIEFRGKNIKTGKWVYGLLMPHSLIEDPNYLVDYWIATGHEDECFPIISETVGQYTGLKDKNGVKIYEGDILIANTTSQRLVKWLVDSWVIVYKEGGFRELSLDIEKSEVVGNIHDNPKLLKKNRSK